MKLNKFLLKIIEIYLKENVTFINVYEPHSNTRNHIKKVEYNKIYESVDIII